MMPDSEQVAGIADLVIVGAGPAGLSAAATAASLGLRPVLVDDHPRPGGQVFRRGRTVSPLPRYAEDISAIYTDPAGCGVDYRPGHEVWAFDDKALHICGPDGPYELRARRTIIATGASEWVLPMPGWTLPGVVTAGGAQSLLKSANLVVGCRVAIAGTGPLILQLAQQLSAAGATVVALLEVSGFREWLRNAFRLLASPPALLQGAGLLLGLARHGVWLRFSQAPLRIGGKDSVVEVEFGSAGNASGRVRTVKADVVCLSYGLVPGIELAAVRGCSLEMRDGSATWTVCRDDDLRTSVEDVFCVGDGSTIGGARIAVLEGRLAGIVASRELGHGNARSEREAGILRRRLARLRALRGFLGATFRARVELIGLVHDDVTLCRCEEVSFGTARRAMEEGVSSLHELRTVCRVGMGPCQGRFCTNTALRLLANATGKPLQNFGPPKPRPPIRPLAVQRMLDS